jgi:hypothetical protein
MEISGKLGDWWKKNAENEVIKAMKDAAENAFVEGDGAILWKSSYKYLPDDYCEKLEYGGYNFSREATRIKRDIQQSKFIEEYREKMKNYKPSEEELYEMRCAFGKDAEIVDIITGQKIFL